MGDILAALLTLAAVSQQVTENVLAAWIKGPIMRLASIGVGVGVTYGAWAIGYDGLAKETTLQIGILGVAVGLGSNVLHALYDKIAPDNGKSPLSSLVK